MKFLVLVVASWTLMVTVQAATGPLAGKSDEEIVASIDAAVESKKASSSLKTALIKLLDDNEAGVRVRERSAWALGELGVSSAVPSLIKAADHKGLLIRSAAAAALQRLRASSAIPVFIKIAQNDPILPLRQRAVIALGSFRSLKAIEPLVQLSSDPSPEVRGASALAMAATHSTKSDFSEILQEMVADENPYVRERAEQALSFVRGKSADVVGKLKAEDSDVRYIASLYFESRGGSKELNALKDAWTSEADDDVRHQLSRTIVSTKKRIQAEKERKEKERRAKEAKEKAAAAAKSAPKAPQ